MEDKITKTKLNVLLVVDTSRSMAGKRIGQVNQAVREIQDYLINLESENSTVDFYLSIITFSLDGKYYLDQKEIPVKDLKFDDIRCKGPTNLDKGYEKIGELLRKESNGGVMPDFGGIAPIILLLTDGHPTSDKAYKDELEKLSKLGWFKVALRYGIAIELNDDRTKRVLKDFVGENGDVIECFDASQLKNIIKIVVLTASKVKSTTSNVRQNNNVTPVNQVTMIRQQVADALTDADGWGW